MSGILGSINRGKPSPMQFWRGCIEIPTIVIICKKNNSSQYPPVFFHVTALRVLEEPPNRASQICGSSVPVGCPQPDPRPPSVHVSLSQLSKLQITATRHHCTVSARGTTGASPCGIGMPPPAQPAVVPVPCHRLQLCSGTPSPLSNGVRNWGGSTRHLVFWWELGSPLSILFFVAGSQNLEPKL